MQKIASTFFHSTAFHRYHRMSSIASPKFKVFPIDVKDKVVLVTGATAGIGEAIAWRFAEAGSKVILVGRRADKLEAVKNEILNCYSQTKIHTVCLDVTEAAKVTALAQSLPIEFSEVDILINNAGLALGVSAVDANNLEDANTVISTNVLGTINFCSAFLPGMKARGKGHLINMGSVAGLYSYATGSVYCASKFAIHGFTLAARHDLMGTPIRVTEIAPGMVGATEFSNVRLKDDAKAAAMYENILHLRPEDVAEDVYYAATRPSHVQISDIVSYATNQAGPRDIIRAGPTMQA